MPLPTMKIQHVGGFAIINVSDFDEAIHVPFVGSDGVSVSAPTPAPVDDVSGDGIEMSNAEIRAEIERLTGEKPAGRTGREKLIAIWEDAATAPGETSE